MYFNNAESDSLVKMLFVDTAVIYLPNIFIRALQLLLH